MTFLIGSLSVPMPKVCSATKSHFWVARLSTAERCLVAESSPSNQVISTFMSLPQASAACLPWAHHVACRPALPIAAFSGLPAGFSSCANAGSKPAEPSSAPARAVAPIALKMSRRVLDSSIRSSSTCFLPFTLAVLARCSSRADNRFGRSTPLVHPNGFFSAARKIRLKIVQGQLGESGMHRRRQAMVAQSSRDT